MIFTINKDIKRSKTTKERQTPDDFDNKVYFKCLIVKFLFPYYQKQQNKALCEDIKEVNVKKQ